MEEDTKFSIRKKEEENMKRQVILIKEQVY
jgi:hypothetical protein